MVPLAQLTIDRQALQQSEVESQCRWIGFFDEQSQDFYSFNNLFPPNSLVVSTPLTFLPFTPSFISCILSTYYSWFGKIYRFKTTGAYIKVFLRD